MFITNVMVGFSGGKNHRSFIGYLTMLLVMCFFTIYGTIQFYKSACPVDEPGNILDGKLCFVRLRTFPILKFENVQAIDFHVRKR